MTENSAFRDLVAERADDESSYTRFMESFIEDHGDMLTEINEKSFGEIFSGIELICSHFEEIFLDRGRDCSVYNKEVFQWEDYYFVFEYNVRGNDMSVNDIKSNFLNTEGLFDKCFTVYPINNSVVEILGDGKASYNLRFLMDFFHSDAQGGELALTNYINALCKKTQ